MTEWRKSVEKYHSYGLNFPQYTETNSKLVEIAELEEGQKIVDLAAGTGFTSKAVLKEQGNVEIYAVDKSKEMLRKAEEYLESENVEHIQSTARNLSNAVPTKVDRVLCNSAIWYFDLETTFKEISNVLKEDGILVFNLNQQFYEGNSESHRKPVVKEIISELQNRGYNPDTELPEPLTKEEIKRKLQETGLELVGTEELVLEGASLKDSIEFFKIPAVAPFFEEIPEKEQQEIMQTVEENLQQKDFPVAENKWTYFKVRKNED